MERQIKCDHFGGTGRIFHMHFGRKLRLAVTVGLSACALSLGLIAPTVSGASSASGTLTFAEGAGANPNWIFPYESCQYCSVDNINQFQDEMFRPLYWFGLGGSVTLVPSLSLADSPGVLARQQDRDDQA